MANEPKRIKWLLECLADDEDLNEWEAKFIESISEQFARKGMLTTAQYDKAEEIYARSQ